MNRVTIKNTTVEGQWILVENPVDLMAFMEHTSNQVVAQVSHLIREKAEVESWGDLPRNTPAAGILAATVAHCKLHGKNPIYELDGIINKRFSNMLAEILDGKRVLINSAGGYCFMLPEWEIETEEPVDMGWKPTHVINDKTQYINLENDPYLEAHTRQYLGQRDTNFSYILNLGGYTKDALVQVFTEFKAKGGKTVYVYTTGMNVPQMYEYFDAAQKAGLNDFEFHFNAFITDGIQGFIEHIKTRANVTIL